MIATHADMVYLDATHARCRHCGTIVCAFATFEMQPPLCRLCSARGKGGLAVDP